MKINSDIPSTTYLLRLVFDASLFMMITILCETRDEDAASHKITAN